MEFLKFTGFLGGNMVFWFVVAILISNLIDKNK